MPSVHIGIRQAPLVVDILWATVLMFGIVGYVWVVNNFLIQYGRNYRDGYAAVNKIIQFPISFNNCYCVLLQVEFNTSWDVFFGTVKTNSVTKTRFIQGYDMRTYWLALGN